MDDGLFSLDDPGINKRSTDLDPMSPAQRQAIRALFARLGVNDAAGQFALVEELTGVRIRSVTELDEPTAQLVIRMLPGKIATSARTHTGNSWDDRDEPTWIDRL
ncbi:hypothetical protein [Agromyces allii]|uniref:hypothetical protein n=1 Tax=Agromyces allii TaxID=393607 RepID=UPI0012F7FB4A|nr:hypothetical protein [Agromyces allii]